MDDQRTDREGGGSLNVNPEFRAELDEILTWSEQFNIEHEPLSERDHEELRALIARMEEFRKKWHVDDPNFNFPTT
jgi:hypothetical protein